MTRHEDDAADTLTTRWWIAITGTALIMTGSLAGWAYSSLTHRLERLEDADIDIRRIQAIRGEDIAALKAQLSEIERQLVRSIQQHHDLEQDLLRGRR